MKQYFTIIQDFQPTHRPLEDYLDDQGIQYTIGADFSEELKRFGYNNANVKSGTLLKKYVVLIDEHELSAIKLCVDGLTIIQNRDSVKVQNTIRGYFAWILD